MDYSTPAVKKGRGRPSGTKKTPVAEKTTPNEMQEPKVVDMKEKMQKVRDARSKSPPKEKDVKEKRDKSPKQEKEISAHAKVMDDISKVAMKNKRDLASLTKKMNMVLKKIS